MQLLQFGTFSDEISQPRQVTMTFRTVSVVVAKTSTVVHPQLSKIRIIDFQAAEDVPVVLVCSDIFYFDCASRRVIVVPIHDYLQKKEETFHT